MSKSIQTAYFCWLVGGLVGLHHLYLGRHKQAFIYLITLGGFLIGVLHDLYRIPFYVNEINNAQEYQKQHKKKSNQLKTPIFTASRFFGSLAVSLAVSKAIAHSLQKDPEGFDLIWFVMAMFIPFVVAILTFLVTSEGPVKVAFKWSLLGSYAGFTIDYVVSGARNYIGSTLFSLFFLNWNIEWDQDYQSTLKKKSLIKYIFLASIGASFIFTCYTLCLVNNLTVEKNGRNMTIRDTLYERFNSEEFKKVKEGLKVLYDYYQAHGFQKLFSRVFYGDDPEAIERAYKVLVFNRENYLYCYFE